MAWFLLLRGLSGLSFNVSIVIANFLPISNGYKVIFIDKNTGKTMDMPDYLVNVKFNNKKIFT